MIGKSDLIILLVSASALAGGIYRWQSNTGAVPAIAGPSNSRVAEPERGLLANANAEQLPVVALSTDAAPAPQVVNEAATPENIVVESSASSGSSASSDTASVASPNSNEAQSLLGVHRVQSGDYLGLIAKRYGTSVETLMELNDLQDNIIQIDQEISYPQPAN
ncbi:MAG: LysM peptidoglycan-binding domain-containing protein [Granulosicoccus sp.]